MEYPGYETIKRYYDLNCYTIEDIHFYTKYGALTRDQYTEITGEYYKEQLQA